MSTPAGDVPGAIRKHRPYVPETMQMKELTFRAMFLGLILTVVLGAANAYLGLRAGITIAATYPAAVISMAFLRAWKGSLLEENIARTAGSIGESVAAGAIFTLPAFVLAGAWPSFWSFDSYWKSTSLIMVGSILGVLFISLVRRVMVEDPELPFPESVAEYRRWRSRLHSGQLRTLRSRKGFLFHCRKPWPQPGPARSRRKQQHCTHGRHQHLRRSQRQPRLSRSRLHHRPPARLHPVRRRCAGLGINGPATYLFPRSPDQALPARRYA